jgi:peptidoglycan glycosyltransferase
MLPTSDRALTARLERLLIVLLLAFGAVALGLVYWTVARSADLLARDDNPRPIEAERRVRRGRILDAQDRMMAGTEGEPNRLQRVYPLATAGPAVGYYSLRHGADGIELSFDSYLSGEGDDDLARYWQDTLHIPPAGRDIRVSLDATLQDRATQLLDGHSGALVVLKLGQPGEPAAIRSMVSRPGYDPNRLDEQFEQLTTDPAAPLFNRAAQGLYQPGLLLSPLILAGALDRELLDTGETLSGVDAPVPVNGHVLQCVEAPVQGAPDPTWLELIALGCAAPLRDLGERLGAGVLDEIFTGFGLTEQPVLPIAASANQTPVADPGLAAIGQDTLTITPLQAARAYAALAQEGMLPPLQLVEGLQDEEGRWQAATAGDVAGQSVAGAAARRVLASLSALGSSRELSVNALAGPRGGTNTWYVGLAPGGNPDTVVVLVLENEEDPATAAEIGREVLGLAAVGP